LEKEKSKRKLFLWNSHKRSRTKMDQKQNG